MGNEELVALIQAGDTGQIMPLWANMRRLAFKEAGRWAAANRNGVELEDLGQEAFIALLEAVGTFDSGVGARFSTWYMVYLKGAFTAACGMRTQRDRLDPLAGAASLDAPASADDQEGIMLGGAPSPTPWPARPAWTLRLPQMIRKGSCWGGRHPRPPGRRGQPGRSGFRR